MEVLDQVCLDLPAAVADQEIAFWAHITGWQWSATSPSEFGYLRRPDGMPVRILTQRLGESEGPVRGMSTSRAPEDRQPRSPPGRRSHGRVGARILDRPARPARPALLPDRPPAPAGHRAETRLTWVQISPSILSADFANLQAELEAVRNADWAHVDVMDAHFVPNLTMGLPVVEALLRVSPIPVDCHLMIEDPDRWAPPYAEAGAGSVTFHVEAAADPRRLARTLRGLGRARRWRSSRHAVGAIRGPPSRPRHGPVMTVEPGFGGQSFMADQMPKVRQVRESVRRHGGQIWVQVDGESPPRRSSSAEAGADVFVAGSAVYGAQDAAAAVDELRALVSRQHC